MVQGKVCVFDTSALMYIYQHSRRRDPHTLLLKNKKPLECKYVLAANDLIKDLPGPLQHKYLTRIRGLFSFEDSPRDEFFEEIKGTAVANNRISQDDIDVDKLTDLDIVRLACHYQEQEEDVIIVTDDEGIHELVKDLDLSDSLEVLYTHLFFLKLLPIVEGEEEQKEVKKNVQQSYYYLNKYLKEHERHLPYEKVINTSIELLSKGYQVLGEKANKLEEKIIEFIDQGKESREIRNVKPLLSIIRKKKIDPDYSSSKACLDLMTTIKEVRMNLDKDISPAIINVVHQEMAGFHLELANIAHKELNLVGALAHIKAASQSIAFLDTKEQILEKSLEELLFIEALLLLELGNEEEALTYFEQILESRNNIDLELKQTAETLLVIYDKKIGLIKESCFELLFELAKEAITIPNPKLAKTILSKMLLDDRLQKKYKKQAAEEIVHLTNLRLLLRENPIVEQAVEILDEKIIDRTEERADMRNLRKFKENFEEKESDIYRGPWEIAEIRNKKKAIWVYAWNEGLKAIWVLQLPGKMPQELDRAKTITFLSGKIAGYKNCMNIEDFKYQKRIVFEEEPVFVIDEKRAFPLW
ncbi:MAG: hypothetical protein GF364_19080 [Candidatus Lokiarchaeota archaeon]|nr:hypothetical protein [Candidatus Lokiarchaeota archaeon]